MGHRRDITWLRPRRYRNVKFKGKKGMLFDFAQQVWSIHGSKELPVENSNNEVIRIFSETDELIVFVNNLVDALLSNFRGEITTRKQLILSESGADSKTEVSPASQRRRRRWCGQRYRQQDEGQLCGLRTRDGESRPSGFLRQRIYSAAGADERPDD